MRNHRHRAFSLVEILIAVAIFTLISSSITILAVDSLRSSQNNRLQFQAAAKIEETTNEIILKKSTNWLDILNNTDAGPKHIEYAENSFNIIDGESTDGDITFNLVINSVFRDPLSGDITTSGGVADINTREVVMTASWQDTIGKNQELSSIIYLTNWNTPTWLETTQADFESGSMNGTIATTTGDGAVELDLDSTVRGDWCLPQITLTEYNMERQGVPTSIVALPNHAYFATGENASGPALEHVSISSTNPPDIQLEQSYTNTNVKVNDLFVEPNYVYLGTTNHSEEVQIIDANSNPFQKIGYYDTNTSKSVQAVTVNNNIGFVTYENKLDSFNLSQRTGSRPQLDSITIASMGVDLAVSGNYLFVAEDSTSNQMQIIDISDPSNLSIVGSTTLNAQQATSIFANQDGTRVYLGTKSSSTQNEFFILDTTQKADNSPIVASMDTQGTSLSDLSIINDYAILVGTNGQEYQVVKLENETAPEKCGGLDNNYGIYGVQTVVDEFGNAWSYVLSGNANAELMVILGGESGGGGGNGQGSYYLESGSYESSVFDTNVESPYYYSISWDETLLDNTDLRLQVRAGSTADLSSVNWAGPDGTDGTYFTNPQGELLPSLVQSKRYIQYKAFYSSDKVNTPVLEEIRINYQ